MRDKKIEDISDLRDESDRDGIRMVIEIKREGNAQIVLNQLFKHTALETSFGVIMLALGRRQAQSPADARNAPPLRRTPQEVVVRRTQV